MSVENVRQRATVPNVRIDVIEEEQRRVFFDIDAEGFEMLETWIDAHETDVVYTEDMI